LQRKHNLNDKIWNVMQTGVFGKILEDENCEILETRFF
jgi:hypothetical protein